MTLNPDLLRRNAAVLDSKGSASTADELRELADRLEAEFKNAEFTPLTECIICGHIKGEHETIERQWCSRCATGGRGKEAQHAFRPAQNDSKDS